MLIFSHFALAQHTGAQPGQVIADEDSLQECMGKSNRIYGVFSGHRNAVLVDRSQKTAHVTCPQIVHYPCAWNVIELYPEGFLCWTREIENLRSIDLSRCEGNRWLFPEWAAQRIGKPDHRSFGDFPWS